MSDISIFQDVKFILKRNLFLLDLNVGEDKQAQYSSSSTDNKVYNIVTEKDNYECVYANKNAFNKNYGGYNFS